MTLEQKECAVALLDDLYRFTEELHTLSVDGRVFRYEGLGVGSTELTDRELIADIYKAHKYRSDNDEAHKYRSDNASSFTNRIVTFMADFILGEPEVETPVRDVEYLSDRLESKLKQKVVIRSDSPEHLASERMQELKLTRELASEKKKKCPKCGSEDSYVQIPSHGVWKFDKHYFLYFNCSKCVTELGRAEVRLGLTPEGIITFSYIRRDNSWADKYYTDNEE